MTKATDRHTPAARLSCTQNTGAPIRRSRIVPPPTPVISAKKASVTIVCPRRAAASAPEAANTASPARSNQGAKVGRSAAGGMRHR